MNDLKIFPKAEFDYVLGKISSKQHRLNIFASMCRLNTLIEIKKAGSGHLGSSFSAMDLITWLYLEEMNTIEVGIDNPDRDIFFSSKGHDVPGQYAVLHALGILPEDMLLKLRRLGGLDGHPERHIDGLEACTGSLGMGISKARGMAWAKRYLNHKGKVYVMIGDGELQEGQIWEALQNTPQQDIDITVIVDHNKIQTDMPVDEIVKLGDLQAKFSTFGWHVERCNGHDFDEIDSVFRKIECVDDKPKIIIADTLKGRGVSFMEKISDMPSEDGKYLWHSGAPDDSEFKNAFDEIYHHIKLQCEAIDIAVPVLKEIQPEKPKAKSKTAKVYISEAFGEALVELAQQYDKLVVVDGDLAADCRIRSFQNKFPDRFIENGIAEQDMVSMAGGLAAQGLLPVVNTFSSFLSARTNEQIYNNTCERTKMIYVAHFSGMIPAGPGKSHQSVRDISLFGALPNMVICQPCNPEEARKAINFCVKNTDENCMLRLNIGPCPREITLPEDYSFQEGKGTVLRKGDNAVIFAYGAVMLHEALLASELAEKLNFSLEVMNMPWLNRIDTAWLKDAITKHHSIYVLEDHMCVGGLGDRLLDELVKNELIYNRKFQRFGLNELPACGTPEEVLKYHGLDGNSLCQKIIKYKD